MELNKKVTVDIVRKGDNFIVGNLRDLSLIVGTTSVSGNLHCFPGIKKGKDFWIVPVEMVKDRVSILKGRLEKLKKTINIMEEILNE